MVIVLLAVFVINRVVVRSLVVAALVDLGEVPPSWVPDCTVTVVVETETDMDTSTLGPADAERSATELER